jgi:fructose-bisphosphate aldolase class II
MSLISMRQLLDHAADNNYGAPFLRHLIQAAMEEWPHIPVYMHQDHGTSPAVCQRSIQLGFSSVMMDGSLMEDGKPPQVMNTMSMLLGGW